MQHCPLIRIQTSWTNYIFSLLYYQSQGTLGILLESASSFIHSISLSFSLPFTLLAPFLPDHFIELSKKRSTSIHNFKTDPLVESWSETSGNRNSYYRSFPPHPAPFPFPLPAPISLPRERDKEFCRILRLPIGCKFECARVKQCFPVRLNFLAF